MDRPPKIDAARVRKRMETTRKKAMESANAIHEAVARAFAARLEGVAVCGDPDPPDGGGHPPTFPLTVATDGVGEHSAYCFLCAVEGLLEMAGHAVDRADAMSSKHSELREIKAVSDVMSQLLKSATSENDMTRKAWVVKAMYDRRCKAQMAVEWSVHSILHHARHMNWALTAARNTATVLEAMMQHAQQTYFIGDDRQVNIQSVKTLMDTIPTFMKVIETVDRLSKVKR
jgi:hypothetical protein